MIGFRTGVNANSAARSATNIAPIVFFSWSFSSFVVPTWRSAKSSYVVCFFQCCMSRRKGRIAGPIQKCQSVRTVVNTKSGMFFSSSSPRAPCRCCCVFWRFSPPSSSFFLFGESERTVVADGDFWGKLKIPMLSSDGRRSGERSLLLRRPELVAAVGEHPNEFVGTGNTTTT